MRKKGEKKKESPIISSQHQNLTEINNKTVNTTIITNTTCDERNVVKSSKNPICPNPKVKVEVVIFIIKIYLKELG